MEIFKAHTQWATRPADERFSSVQALYDATAAYAATAVERENVSTSTLRVENVDGSVQLVGKGNQPAALTHWAFGQLAARVQAPASYLRELPATLAVQNLNHGLAKRLQADADDRVNLLLHANGSLLVRAFTSEKYERIWNHEVASRLLRLQAYGWAPATPDVRKIDDGLPLYASDHDMFAFMAHNERTINEPGNPDGLKRGFIVGNSEVGASSLWILRFLYREMCGNHIIWGATQATEIRARHTKNVRDKMRMWDVEVRKYMDSSATLEETAIAYAKEDPTGWYTAERNQNR